MSNIFNTKYFVFNKSFKITHKTVIYGLQNKKNVNHRLQFSLKCIYIVYTNETIPLKSIGYCLKFRILSLRRLQFAPIRIKCNSLIGFNLISVPSLYRSNYLRSFSQEPLVAMVAMEFTPYSIGL